MAITTTKVHTETLEAIRKIQSYSVLHDLPKETIPDLIDRLVQVELSRVSDGNEFSLATYELGKAILERTKINRNCHRQIFSRNAG